MFDVVQLKNKDSWTGFLAHVRDVRRHRMQHHYYFDRKKGLLDDVSLFFFLNVCYNYPPSSFGTESIRGDMT